jgi:hypothetical protein
LTDQQGSVIVRGHDERRHQSSRNPQLHHYYQLAFPRWLAAAFLSS